MLSSAISAAGTNLSQQARTRLSLERQNQQTRCVSSPSFVTRRCFWSWLLLRASFNAAQASQWPERSL